jgi:hypothetical protein
MGLSKEECHEILGVKVGDDMATVKSAYKKLALKVYIYILSLYRYILLLFIFLFHKRHILIRIQMILMQVKNFFVFLKHIR